MAVLDADDVGVAVLSLDVGDACLARLERLLSPDELARAARLVPAVRRGFVAGRGLLRTLLGRLLDAAPGGLVIEAGPRGKPALAGRHAGRLHFNLSHCRGECLVAVSSRHPLGVDLELRRADHGSEWVRLMAGSILAAEELARHETLPEAARPAELLEAWVVKEAVLKATGAGIGAGVRHLVVPAPLPRGRLAAGGDAVPVELAAVHGAPAVGVCVLDGVLTAARLQARRPPAAAGGAFAAVACVGAPRIMVRSLAVPAVDPG